MTGSYAIGVDIGGTFTDFVLLDLGTGEVRVGKVLTTPGDPSLAVQEGVSNLLAEAKLEASAIDLLIHGTTLVINALIERKGARTALVTTVGFRDVLKLRRETRYDVFDLDIVLPQPLVRRRDTHEVNERMDFSGAVLEPLVLKDLDLLAKKLQADEIQSVAISFLHSYRNPAHERMAEAKLREVMPSLSISTSHSVLSQWREFERAIATVINAYTQPITERYIERIDKGLSANGFRGKWYVMAANAGIVTPPTAAKYPIRVLESGPVGGALAAAHVGGSRGESELLAFDMGGTTAKVCIIQEGVPLITTDYEVARVKRLKRGSGLPVKLPVIDMIEIGAGGGSIGRIDELGLISVGPDSAGADPGPACYGRGGTHPTVTDANLLLGYLNADYFLGGSMRLDTAAAERALASVGAPIGMDAREVASTIHSVVTGSMAEAARVHAIERDIDYRRLDLMAFGGAGPLHAYGIAAALDIRRVIFPRAAGVFSALGFLTARLSFDFVRTYAAVLEHIDPGAPRGLFHEMERDAFDIFDKAGTKRTDLSLARTVDMRYVGQGHELQVDLPETYLIDGDSSGLRVAFERAYERRYGRTLPELPVEVVNWRLLVTGPRPNVPAFSHEVAPGTRAPIRRRAYSPASHEWEECDVYSRYSLATGQSVKGPALIEERECTLYIGPTATATIDEFKNAVMEMR